MQLEPRQTRLRDARDLIERIIGLRHHLAEAEEAVGMGFDQANDEVVLDALGQRADHC